MKSKKGFTLVELLAVIAILAILVIVAMPNVLKLFRQSRVNANLIVAENYINAGEQYYAKQFGLSSDFNGKNNISSKLDMSGKRADEEKVFINVFINVVPFISVTYLSTGTSDIAYSIFTPFSSYRVSSEKWVSLYP